jgi:hypothetical protein
MLSLMHQNDSQTMIGGTMNNDYPIPDNAQAVSDRLWMGKYIVIYFPKSGGYAFLDRQGNFRIINQIILRSLHRRYRQ